MSDDLERRLREQGATAPGAMVTPAQVWQGVRRRRRRLAAVATGGTAVVLAVAVGLVATSGGTGSRPAPAVAAEYRGVELALERGDLTARDVAAAYTGFGVDLLHAMCAARPDENVVLSPTSAAVALGMVQPAANGATAEDLAEVLHLPTWSPELVAALHDHTAALQALAAEDDPDVDADRVRMSNRVWMQQGVAPTPEYLDGVATAYDAGLEALDFAGQPDAATARINEAVDDDTAGLIPSLFDAPLDPLTRVVLTNAVHFKATWATEFDDAEPEPFAAPGGEVTADLMSGGAGYVRSADGWTSVEIPYADESLAAVAVLPPEGTDPCSATSADLGALLAGEGTGVGVTVPRMRLEQSHDLLPALDGLGLPTGGDFSGLYPAAAQDDLSIDQVVQKTFLEVDETGTEAAAATGVAMVAESAVEPRQVVLDRPFLLLLTDVETRSPLFLSVINDPTGS